MGGSILLLFTLFRPLPCSASAVGLVQRLYPELHARSCRWGIQSGHAGVLYGLCLNRADYPHSRWFLRCDGVFRKMPFVNCEFFVGKRFWMHCPISLLLNCVVSSYAPRPSHSISQPMPSHPPAMSSNGARSFCPALCIQRLTRPRRLCDPTLRGFEIWHMRQTSLWTLTRLFTMANRMIRRRSQRCVILHCTWTYLLWACVFGSSVQSTAAG